MLSVTAPMLGGESYHDDEGLLLWAARSIGTREAFALRAEAPSVSRFVWIGAASEPPFRMRTGATCVPEHD